MWTDLVARYNGTKLVMFDHDRDTPAGNEFARRHGFFSQPAMVIFGAAGQIAHKGYGPSTAKETEELVRRWAEGRG